MNYLELVVNIFKNQVIWAGISFYLGLIWFGLVLYTWFDIKDRTRSRGLVFIYTFLVLVGGVFGLLLYMFLRPRMTLAQSASKNLEEKLLVKESLESICPKCAFLLERDYMFCPNCAQSLKKVCLSCNKISQIAYVYCPYCSGSESRLVGMEELKTIGIIKRLRGRPKKLEVLDGPPKRPRGRPRKYPLIVNDEKSKAVSRRGRSAKKFDIDQALLQEIETVKREAEREEVRLPTS